MECPGSVALLKHLEIDDESDEPDYRREGTAMHEAAAYCLDNNCDTWEILGRTFNDTVMERDMLNAIQVYLDYVRPIADCADEVWVEKSLARPKVHPQMYGSLDFGARLRATTECFDGKPVVVVVDLKGGEGIVVEPDENPQEMYYAFMLIDEHPEWPDDMAAMLAIVQPRAFHHAGPIRAWWTTVGHIRRWTKDVLVPAMVATQFDNTLDAGPHCRFCPAKLVCPLLTSLARAAATHDPAQVVRLTDESLGESYRLAAAVKFYLKALEEETFKRLSHGKTVPHTKLVPKKANRVWNGDAIPKAKELFGAEAMTEPQVKSPAELEKLGPAAKEFVKEYAHMPNTGLTVALATDSRVAVVVPPVEKAFGALLKNLDTPQAAE